MTQVAIAVIVAHRIGVKHHVIVDSEVVCGPGDFGVYRVGVGVGRGMQEPQSNVDTTGAGPRDCAHRRDRVHERPQPTGPQHLTAALPGRAWNTGRGAGRGRGAVADRDRGDAVVELS
ncbi:hypothetical protein C5E41_26060 [Nocardia nova]|nr:hypothetical protein C5E41_26060 [Nocardia nova]